MSFLHRLFKFRIFKFRTTLSEELEDLHTESIHLQQALTQKRLQQRVWTKWLAIYAVLVYLALNVVYFTLFLSHDYLIRTYAVIISVAVGALLYGVYWLTCWYFRTIIQMKEDRLALFKDRKQELIQEVKTKETYSVAKALLEKYGETITPVAQPAATAANANPDLRQRVSIKPVAPASDKPAITVIPPNIGRLESSNTQTPMSSAPVRMNANGTPAKLPRAILPPQRTFWGAILDVVVGDGPSKRYALICKSCHSHNGMALEEEYEYLSFRCAYCNYFNSARKQKPVFHGDIVAHDPPSTTASPPSDEPVTARADLSSSESSDSLGEKESATTGSTVTHRFIRVPSSENANESRSASTEHQRDQQPDLSSSSEESLTKKE